MSLKVLPMKLLLQTSWALADKREILVGRFPFVIGRGSSADCSLPLELVSRRHCQLTRTGDQVLVQDLQSRNGTFVNGKRASSPLPVDNGDELRLGPCAFRVSILCDSGELSALGPGMAVTEAPAAGPSHAGDEASVNSVSSLVPPKPGRPKN
jgi:predicted component of type VI protein secretion system